MRIRIKHNKTGSLVFLSHLDMMLTMNRALRRSGLPFACTEGFHPKPKFSFGQPLGVGMASTGEYFDLVLQRNVPISCIFHALTAVLPSQLQIQGVQEISPGESSLMALLWGAVYEMWFPMGKEFEEKKWNAMKGAEEEFHRLLIQWEWLGEEEGLAGIRLLIRAGSKENLKPKEFSTYLEREGLASGPCWMIRRELYIEKDGTLQTPFGMEVKI